MQHRLKDQEEELIAINLVKERKSAQCIFLSAILSLDHKKSLLNFFKDIKDVFAYTYVEMPRVGQHLVSYKFKCQRKN